MCLVLRLLQSKQYYEKNGNCKVHSTSECYARFRFEEEVSDLCTVRKWYSYLRRERNTFDEFRGGRHVSVVTSHFQKHQFTN